MLNDYLRLKPTIIQRKGLYHLYNLKNPSERDISDFEEYFKYEWINHRDEYNYMIVDANDESFNFEYYKTLDEVFQKYTSFSMFGKEDRSSFSYWFAHWCGFQLTALNLGIWKPKYLLHDIEKPWLKLLWKGDYKKVQKWHRNHNKHHLEYGLKHGWNKIDWEALMIDWQCCGLSKQQAQLDARETMEYEVKKEKWHSYEKDIRSHLEPILIKNHL